MFNWTSPQPIPEPLARLLEAAGCHPYGAKAKADLTVFMPPHLLVAAEQPQDMELANAYADLQASGSPGRLVNGERLLGLRPAELAHWLLTDTLTFPLKLQRVEPLLGAVTLTLLDLHPQLEACYLKLEENSERAGAPVDNLYRQRLAATEHELISAWHQGRGQGEPEGNAIVRSLARGLELQVIQAAEARETEKNLNTARQALEAQLDRAQALLLRMGALLSRGLQAPPPSPVPGAQSSAAPTGRHGQPEQDGADGGGGG